MSSPRRRTTLISTIALSAAATLGFASAASAADVATYPLEAFPGFTVVTAFPDYVIEVECDEWTYDESFGEFTLVWVPGGSLEVRFDCEIDDADVVELDEDLAAGDFPPAITPLPVSGDIDEAFAVEPNTDVTFLFNEQELEIEYTATVVIDDPAGDLLFSETLTVPEDGAQIADFGAGSDTVPNCEWEDRRVYAKLDFTVLDSGGYTFRVVGVTPLQSGEYLEDEASWYDYAPNPWGDYLPIIDPLLVLYSDFDPDNAELGMIACDDDSDTASLDDGVAARDSLDRYISDLYSELAVTLAPGQYTLVLTTYDSIDDGAAEALVPAKAENEGPSPALAPAVYEVVDLPAQTGDVDIWGVEDGLVLGHVAFLADTGADASASGALAAGSLLMLLVGAGAIIVARRRTS